MSLLATSLMPLDSRVVFAKQIPVAACRERAADRLSQEKESKQKRGEITDGQSYSSGAE